MRRTYNWQLLHAEFQLAKVKYPSISMAAFAKSRGIPSSTFRKAILRESRKGISTSLNRRASNLELAIKLLHHAVDLMKQA